MYGCFFPGDLAMRYSISRYTNSGPTDKVFINLLIDELIINETPNKPVY